MTTATRTRGLRVTNIGPSSAIQALMVRIDWTSAPVVRIEARKDIKLQAATVAIRKGEYTVLANVQVEVPAERVLYFCRSSFEGWYYILMYTSNHFGCTCPAGKTHHQCSHQATVSEFAAQRTQREQDRSQAVPQTQQVAVCEVVEHSTDESGNESRRAAQPTADDRAEARRECERVTAELVLFQAGKYARQLDRAS